MAGLNHPFEAPIREKPFNTLIVEDSLAYRTAIKNLLITHLPNMALREAATAGEALVILDKFYPDIVFLDIKLPDSSGLELIEKIKTRYSPAIVIMLTSYDLQEYRTQALLSGADHFLAKGSTDLADILALVETILAHMPLEKSTG